ncbi:MAG: Arsenate-mycothiol transferase ArsC1 [Actinomycetota bacterium]|jgi:arsenate-mycothiol transferase
MTNQTTSLLFVCVHNAGKSQMAAALMRAKNLPNVEVRSGGTHHGDHLNAEAQAAVGELGVTMDGEYSKAISNDIFMNTDRIIILGNEAKLTPVEGMRGTIETWLTPEPTAADGDKLAQTRIVRDDIVRRIDALALELSVN